MPTGVVKTVRSDFGFIRPDGSSEDAFFHASALQGELFSSALYGRRVQFELFTTEKGLKAKNVKVLPE